MGSEDVNGQDLSGEAPPVVGDISGFAGGKPMLKSKTIQGNILSILASVFGMGLILKGGVPPEILLPSLTAAGASVWGNVLSIFGRVAATEPIK